MKDILTTREQKKNNASHKKIQYVSKDDISKTGKYKKRIEYVVSAMQQKQITSRWMTIGLPL